MEILGDIWNGAIIRPMVNSLVLLYAIFFSNFGLAILLFTVVVRAAMVPLTIRQSRSMKAMSSLQPKMKAVQEKYKNDRQRLSQETMKLYRFDEVGFHPKGKQLIHHLALIDNLRAWGGFPKMLLSPCG